MAENIAYNHRRTLWQVDIPRDSVGRFEEASIIFISFIDNLITGPTQLFNHTTVEMNRVHEKYAYVSHPDNLPLELSGNAKKRGALIKKEDYNGAQCSLNEDSRSLLFKKMSNNCHDFANTKSILPTSDNRKLSRPHSIKTFKEDKQNINASGIQYLMHKTEKLKPTNHRQRSHVSEAIPTQPRATGKKHYNYNESFESIDCPVVKPCHKETMEVKLANDIYSNPYRMEQEPVNSKRIQANNLFKNGEELGLERKREKKLSENKLFELIGNEAAKGNKPAPIRERRQDWRVSNINFF